MSPSTERILDCIRHRIKGREVAVMRGLSTREFPHALDRVEVGTVRRKILQGELTSGVCAPFLMQASVVVPGVVGDDEHPSPRTRTGRTQYLEETEERFGIEHELLLLVDELAVA